MDSVYLFFFFNNPCWSQFVGIITSVAEYYCTHISCELLSFTLNDSWTKIADYQYSFITKGSIYQIKHMYFFYHSNGLTRNWMFNGIIYYFLLLILRFNLLWQISPVIENMNVCSSVEKAVNSRFSRKIAKHYQPINLLHCHRITKCDHV